jgi:hypothetical protein
MLSVRYPNLTDVWTNHLSAFLLPNVLRMRKYLAIALYEMERRKESGVELGVFHWSSVLSMPDGDWHVTRCFWLNDFVAVLGAYCKGEMIHHVLHLTEHGTVHCDHVLYTNEHPVTLWDWLLVHGLVGEKHSETYPLCLTRALMLHDIRISNRQ